MSISKYYIPAFLAIPFVFSLPSEAAKPKRPKKKTQSTRAASLSPEEQLKTFKLPEGFVIELVASEKNGLINPIDLAFDDAGRLWTQTAEMYPLDPNAKVVGRKSLEALDKGTIGKKTEFQRIKELYQLKQRGTDKILIIEDPTKQVKGEIPVFAEGITIPQSLLPYKDGVFVAHGSEMLFIGDKNGDGKADYHENVLSGFGYTDTHTMSHTLVRGPGGWVHFSHGALNKGKVVSSKSGNSTQINFSKIGRFSLDGKNVEVVNNGLNNIWGFQLKGNGQWYGTEANDLFYSLVPMHPMMGYPGIGNDKLKPYQPFAPKVHQFKVNGTGISGLAYDENGKSGFPDEWKNIGFLANPITSAINCVVSDRNPDGSVISKHFPDFLTCSDDWFRPVNIEFGPDGCLYIVDWYNKIISHNEVSRDHPDRDVTHGRIWRIRYEGQKASVANVLKSSDKELIKHLRAEIQWEKRAAWHQIADRQVKSLVPELTGIVKDAAETVDTRVLALWSLESLGAYDLELMKVLTADENADIRREALRSLNTFQPGISDVVTLTKPLISDPHYMVKEQVLRTLAKANAANSDSIKMLVSAAKPEKKGKNAFGGIYENNFQRFLALMALEQYPSDLMAFIDSPLAKEVASANLNEASRILPKEDRTLKILASLKSGKSELDGDTLVALSESMDEPKVLKALGAKLATREFVQLALDNQSRLRSSSLLKALEPGLKALMVSSAEDQSFALDAAIRFQSGAINDELIKVLGSTQISKLNSQQVEALLIEGKKNSDILHKIATNAEVEKSVRLKALLALALVDPRGAMTVAEQAYKAGDDYTKSVLVTGFRYSEQGGLLLLHLINKKLLSPEKLELETAQRILESHKTNAVAKSLAKGVRARLQAASAVADGKVKQFTEEVEKLKGNPEMGKAMFGSCLQCHQAGDKGLDIAPSLDGGRKRNIEHMLVAIVKPNDAMEGGYRLYRITTKSGDILEGYMYNSNANGTTLAFMGGGKKFIPKEQIKKERFINGQSFMPSMFGDLEGQTMADLISYIKTIP
ncbi:MAG: PVC-type heme-binding CxxCH protein [Akkermansiaceae bacterium]